MATLKVFTMKDVTVYLMRHCFTEKYYDEFNLEDYLFDREGQLKWSSYFREMKLMVSYIEQKAEFDCIVGCLSYCSVWYNMELGYNAKPTLFTISQRYEQNRMTFPEDYIEKEEEEDEDEFNNFIHAFEHLHINATARNNTEVTIYVRLPGLTYSVEVFKIENGLHWRNARWYRYHYKNIFFKHTSFDDIKELE